MLAAVCILFVGPCMDLGQPMEYAENAFFVPFVFQGEDEQSEKLPHGTQPSPPL